MCCTRRRQRVAFELQVSAQGPAGGTSREDAPAQTYKQCSILEQENSTCKLILPALVHNASRSVAVRGDGILMIHWRSRRRRLLVLDALAIVGSMKHGNHVINDFHGLRRNLREENRAAM